MQNKLSFAFEIHKNNSWIYHNMRLMIEKIYKQLKCAIRKYAVNCILTSQTLDLKLHVIKFCSTRIY